MAKRTPSRDRTSRSRRSGASSARRSGDGRSTARPRRTPGTKSPESAAERAETLVFRALADPTRRALLDLLRAGPQTAGVLASAFEMTRFGVRKHLLVLVEAGLVLVEARGRERWHRLNPVPIREIARRWLLPFEEGPADRLLALKRLAEEGDPS